jgi:hypothetical protein
MPARQTSLDVRLGVHQTLGPPGPTRTQQPNSGPGTTRSGALGGLASGLISWSCMAKSRRFRRETPAI